MSRGGKAHFRSTDELHYICWYVLKRIKEAEEQFYKEIEETQRKFNEETAEARRLKDNELFEAKKAEMKEELDKYRGKWFTYIIKSDGRVSDDGRGDFKKIKTKVLKQFIAEAEDKWAEANKEKPLNMKSVYADLRESGVVTSNTGRETGRPRDFFGNPISDNSVSGVAEFSIPWMEFYASGYKGGINT